MMPNLSDSARDRLTAATDGTRPFTLRERVHWTHLEAWYGGDDRDLIRTALTTHGKPDHPRPGANGRAEAARRYGTR